MNGEHAFYRCMCHRGPHFFKAVVKYTSKGDIIEDRVQLSDAKTCRYVDKNQFEIDTELKSIAPSSYYRGRNKYAESPTVSGIGVPSPYERVRGLDEQDTVASHAIVLINGRPNLS
jgi:hypothetical protein